MEKMSTTMSTTNTKIKESRRRNKKIWEQKIEKAYRQSMCGYACVCARPHSRDRIVAECHSFDGEYVCARLHALLQYDKMSVSLCEYTVKMKSFENERGCLSLPLRAAWVRKEQRKKHDNKKKTKSSHPANLLWLLSRCIPWRLFAGSRARTLIRTHMHIHIQAEVINKRRRKRSKMRQQHSDSGVRYEYERLNDQTK